MDFRKCWQVVISVCLCTACSTAGPASLPPSAEALPTAKIAASLPTAASVSSSTSEYLLSRIPHCNGIEIRDPFTFNWPNLAERIRELNTNLWGYFACNQSPSDVAQFYRADMPKPPYNMQETNWIDRKEGSVGVFYNSAYAWIYLWVIPQPSDPQASYVIIAQSFNAVSC